MNSIEDDVLILDKLIGDILKMSKIDLHETFMRIKPVKIFELLSGILEEFKPTMDQKYLILDCHIQEYIIVAGDRDGLGKFFHPFFRGHRSVESGSELGLYIAEKIIKQHKSSITVQNTDKGVMFQIIFQIKSYRS